MNPKLPRGTLDSLWSNPQNWKAYGLYFCPEDPRFIVPKRCKWAGWTINASHASGWIALAVAIVYLMLPLTFLANIHRLDSTAGFGTVIFLLISVSGICWFLASPDQYEEKS